MFEEPKELSPAFLNTKIKGLIHPRNGVPAKTKIFGVEIEVEFHSQEDVARVLTSIEETAWRPERDNSLRGANCEFVFNGAKTETEAFEMMDQISSSFKKIRKKKESSRTSVHVHLNFCDKTVRDLWNFTTIYTYLEDVLLKVNGPDRRGSLFCLRVQDSQQILKSFKQSFEREDIFSLIQNEYRYANMNLCSLGKFGSVELRGHEGTLDTDRIKEWMKVLLELYEYSCKMDNPHSIIQNISGMGNVYFVEQTLPRTYQYIKGLEALGSCLDDAIQYAQEFAYAGYVSEEDSRNPQVKKKKHPYFEEETFSIPSDK